MSKNFFKRTSSFSLKALKRIFMIDSLIKTTEINAKLLKDQRELNNKAWKDISRRINNIKASSKTLDKNNDEYFYSQSLKRLCVAVVSYSIGWLYLFSLSSAALNNGKYILLLVYIIIYCILFILLYKDYKLFKFNRSKLKGNDK